MARRQRPATTRQFSLANMGPQIADRIKQCLGSPCFWLMVLWLLPHRATAGTSVGLAWDPSPDAGVIGYRLHFGTDPQTYSNTLDVGSGTQAVASELQWDTLYFFAVTAYDAAGLESDFSGSIAYRTPMAPATTAPPVIHQDPAGQVVAKGTNTSLSVQWTGGSPMVFQWFKEDLPVSNGPHYDGADAATLTISDADDSCAGVYSIVLSNPSGSVRSLAASVHVLGRPRIQAISPLADGVSRVSVAGENITPLSPSQVFRLTVIASTNLEPRNAWLSVTNAITLKDGVLSADDLSAPDHPQRYYRALLAGTSSTPVRLKLPESLGNGSLRIGMEGADGLSLNSAEILNYEIKVATNFQPDARWTLLTHNMFYSNGVLSIEDTNTTWGQLRAYQVFTK